MKRREFLRNTGWFVVGATLVGLPACGDNKANGGGPDGGPPGGGSDGGGGGTPPDPAGTFSFPQGVASGDPQATSVVLWTRAVKNSDATVDVALHVQVSTDPEFAAGNLVVDKAIAATSASDHTVRVLVNGLSPATIYHYRFVAGADIIPGRTITAPDPAADVQVNFAWVSCQDYGAGNYGAYRQMLIDDAARPAADRIHAVLHLGDMIYETVAKDFQTAVDEDFNAIQIVNRDGKPRGVAAFPSGGGTRPGVVFAKTLDDYRHLYKTFLSDPDIQAARAQWPFVAVWDDHEFTDDCWQSQANYTDADSLDEGDQSRKIAGSQAWFEFVPAHLTGAGGVTGVMSQARDFTAPAKAVVDAPMTAAQVNADTNFTDEANNTAAVGAITIYRSLRFGKHVELVMTDQRSYRSDHAIPEDFVAFFNQNVAPAFFAPRNVVPQKLCDFMDLGKAGGDKIPDIGLPNPRKDAPAGTMLGKAQKQWWKDTMLKSDATWKLWGSEVTFMRLRVPALDKPASGTTPAQPDISPRVVSADAWDGYPSERKELMDHIKKNNIKNLLVLSGDIHSSWAGIVHDDFDSKTPTPLANELVAAGISSNSFFSFIEFATRTGDPNLRALVTVDGTPQGMPKFTENLNLLIKAGLNSAAGFAQGFPLSTVLGAGVAVDVNPHLKYIDTNSQGYGYVKVTADQVTGVITTIKRPIQAPTDDGPGVLRTATFTIPAGDPNGMSEATFTGTKPFPLT